MPLKIGSTNLGSTKKGSTNIGKVMLGTKVLKGRLTELKIIDQSHILNYSGANSIRITFRFNTNPPTSIYASIGVSGNISSYHPTISGGYLHIDIYYYASGYITAQLVSIPSYKLSGSTSYSLYTALSGYESGSGSGSLEDPYLIGSSELLNDMVPFNDGWYFTELQSFGNLHFKLISNIFGQELWNAPYFLGYNCSFDGNYHCIWDLSSPLFKQCMGDVSNLYILSYYTHGQHNGTNHVSLIELYGGVSRVYNFTNIAMCWGSITRYAGAYPFGSILDICESTSLIYMIGCSVNNVILQGDVNIGGLAGGCAGSQGLVIANCYSTAEIQSDGGAFAGWYNADQPVQSWNSFYVDNYDRYLPLAINNYSGEALFIYNGNTHTGTFDDFRVYDFQLMNLSYLFNEFCQSILGIPGTYISWGSINNSFPIQEEFLANIEHFF